MASNFCAVRLKSCRPCRHHDDWRRDYHLGSGSDEGGSARFILKPFTLNAVLPVLSRAVTVRRLRFEKAELVAHLDEVRAYGYKAERAAALIYAHFKKEFGVHADK